MGMTKTEALPKTIQALIAETEAIGGQVRETSPRRFEFDLPCRVVGGAVRLVCRGAVGYFVQDGRNKIKGVAALRSEIAYWTKQSRTA